MDFIKFCVGIDCGKEELVCCFSGLDQDLFLKDFAVKSFANNPKGFAQLLKWVGSFKASKDLTFVMEATGVYHEDLAFFLDEKGFHLSVVLPSKIKHFRKSMEIKTDTDYSASIGIAHFGLSRKLSKWNKPHPVMRTLRNLTRERDQVITDRTSSRNALHALEHSHAPNKSSQKRLKARIKLCDAQEKEIEQEISAVVKANVDLHERIQNICTIKGIGLITAAIIIAETDGFAMIRNKRQLVSYAGMDVVEKQSGISIRGKSKISKRGNRHIRKALYFPSITAIKYNPDLKDQFIRIQIRTAIKMKGYVAIQRKLLVLIYTLWKKNEPFNPEYQNQYNEIKKIGTVIAD